MSLKWDEKTLSKFYENTKKAILALNNKVNSMETQTKVNFDVSEESIRGIVEQYVGDGDETLKKKMAVFQETADGISAIVTKMEKSAIVAVRQKYYLSDSHETLIGGEWQDAQPEWVDGKYIWVMSVITQANGEVTYDGAVCITGNTGQSGVGDGVDSYTAYYKLGTSATVKPEAPSTSWAKTPPEVQTDTYLWVAYLVTYTSGKTEWTEPYCATDAIARGEIKEVSSKIEELAGSILLEVTDGSSTGTASIKLTVNGEAAGSGTIDMSGIVLFKSFLNSTQTKINGGMIETDTLFAQNIQATGSFQVNNGTYKITETSGGVEIGNALDSVTEKSILKFGSGTALLSALLITLSSVYRGFTGQVEISDGSVSLLAKSDGAWSDAFSYGVDVDSDGVSITGPTSVTGNMSVSGTLSAGSMDIDTLDSCPAISEQTVYSTGPSSVSLSAGVWKDVKYFKVTPGTYVVTGCIRFANQAGNSFSTKITTDNGGDCRESLNSVYCLDSAYYSSNSTAIVTISSSDYINLTVYSASAITAYEATLKAVKIHG